MEDIVQQVEDGFREFDEEFISALHDRSAADSRGKFLRLTPKIEAAVRAAASLHSGQVRKGRAFPMPYICHPLSVAEILSRHTDDEDVITAGLLHDAVEDCDYSPEEMHRDFGARVGEFVLGLTEDQTLKQSEDQRGTWRERKQLYLDHLFSASTETLMVACADKIHNIATMIDGYKELGPVEFPKRFNAPIESQLWYYEQFLEIVGARLEGSQLFSELSDIYDRFKKVLTEK